MKRAAWLGVVATWLAIAPAPAPAASSVPSPSASTIRGFFAALERHEFGRALALTGGPAADMIAQLLGHIDREAARKHAVVELKIRSLRLAERAPDGEGQIPVDVSYDIDVFGKKWLVSWFARKLQGTATFRVDQREPRIVAIIGQLDP